MERVRISEKESSISAPPLRRMELLLRTNFDIPKPPGGVFDRKFSSDSIT